MLTQPTIEKLHALHLIAMAQAFEHQRGSAPHAELHFDDRFGLLVPRRPEEPDVRPTSPVLWELGEGNLSRLPDTRASTVLPFDADGGRR